MIGTKAILTTAYLSLVSEDAGSQHISNCVPSLQQTCSLAGIERKEGPVCDSSSDVCKGSVGGRQEHKRR